MGIRLFLFLVVLLLTIFLGVVAILLLSGTFTAGLSETGKMVEQELIHASEGISRQYGQLSLEAIEFSKGLSRSIEEKTSERGISLAHLQQHPEILEEIISGEYERALFALQLSKSSGVFFILNATVNPDLPYADRSRAGLYLKNMEPNILNAAAPTIIVLRGFPVLHAKIPFLSIPNGKWNSMSVTLLIIIVPWKLLKQILHSPCHASTTGALLFPCRTPVMK